MRGAARDRHGSRGGVRWTRQRRAGTRIAGRKPGLRACALYKGRVQGPEAREGLQFRWTTALRGAAGMEMHPTDADLARRPKSCGPDARRWHQGDASSCAPTGALTQASTDGDEPKRMNRRRGEHEASRQNHRVRNAGCLRCFRGDYTRALSQLCA
jgi:hypothetical protein